MGQHKYEEAYRAGYKDGQKAAHTEALRECLDEMPTQDRAEILHKWGADMNVQELIDAINQQWEERLDKIAAEIKALSNANPSYWHSGDMVDRDDVLQIIDKYRKE